ncbi:MAG: cell division protein FtsA [Akkermansia sp.]|nr:cell division protein FtsA [Akkermansia sp.]
MAKSKILVGLEIGTTKTCMVVGEIRPDASATIIGIGEVQSAGIRKGEIVDPAMARQCVCDAWQLAQDHADVDILNVFLSVTGDHLQGENNVGSFRLPDDEDVIDEEHVDNAREKAEKMEIATDRIVLNRELGGYSIDGGEPTRHPEGLTGRTLDVNCHVVHGVRTRLQNSLLCVRQVPLEVEDLVFAPLATAQMVLTRQQKDAGALLIDIGGGTTDFICYKGGDVIASGCIPRGGNTINQDIVRFTEQRVAAKAAEVLKCTEGNAFGDVKDRSLAQYRDDLGMHEVSIPRGELNRIVRDSLAHTLLRVRERIPQEVFARNGMSIYLSGGTSLMRGLDALTRYIFYNVPVHQPAPMIPGQSHSYLADPRYCTAIGLIRFAQRYDDEALTQSGRSWWSRFLRSLGLAR